MILEYLVSIVLTGVVATAVMDMWIVLRKRLFGIPALDYRLVGRWFAYLPHGRFRHHPIAASAPVHGERAIGWTIHYLTGIAFAAVLLAMWGLEWVRDPSIAPALLVGIGSVVAPFFLMQPGMGAGVAASRTPRPAAARIQTLITHGIFGFGLYAGGWAANLFHTA